MICYVLYSSSIDQYYVGITTESVESRLYKHNEAFYGKTFTSKVNDWVVYLEIPCECKQQMFMIEKHIKRMKSKKYIENLTKYPEIIIQLCEKYSCN
jgi:putative endonuclease